METWHERVPVDLTENTRDEVTVPKNKCFSPLQRSHEWRHQSFMMSGSVWQAPLCFHAGQLPFLSIQESNTCSMKKKLKNIKREKRKWKKVQNPLDWLGTTKWPPLYNFDTTKWLPFYIGRNIWLPWSQIKSNTTHRCYRDCTWLYTTCAWRQVGSDSTPHSSMIDNLMCPRRPYTNWSMVNKVTQGRLVTVVAFPLCSQNKCTTKKTVNLEKVNLNKTLKWCSIVKSWKWSDPWKS